VSNKPDYTDAFEVTRRASDNRSPEQWARAMFEGAPMLVRWFLIFGWRVVLGLRLGPRPSAGHVLGWRIAAVDSGAIHLDAVSPLANAELVVRVTNSTVGFATNISYARRATRLLWAVVRPIHQWIVPYLLKRAATRPKPLVIRFQRRIANPIARRLAPYLPGQAVIETIGRRSGLPRRTPVGGRLAGSTFWLVSEFGRHSNYVRNIDADPHVRVQVNGRWHTGTATILDHDEPRERLKNLPWVNSLVVRVVGTDLLTVRVDLENPAAR
jgi:deazaflavin-dependent oxidoreductase (nitroreductase family)